MQKRKKGISIITSGWLILLALGGLVRALNSQTPPSHADLALLTADFVISPAWVVGGVSLWRRQALGYAVGLGLLFQASMLFVGLIVFLLVQPFLTAEPFALADLVVILVMGLVCLVPFALFVRGMATKHTPSST